MPKVKESKCICVFEAKGMILLSKGEKFQAQRTWVKERRTQSPLPIEILYWCDVTS